MRNAILGMASRDLSNTKTTILGATPGAIPRIDGTHMKDFHLPLRSRSLFFENWGGPRAQDLKAPKECSKKFAATFKGKCLIRGNVHRFFCSYKILGRLCRKGVATQVTLTHCIYWAIPPVRLGLSGRNFGKIPETLSDRFLNSPREYGWDFPNPISVTFSAGHGKICPPHG